MSLSASSAARSISWAQMAFALSSRTSSPSQMIRSRRSRLKIESLRPMLGPSPRAVKSLTWLPFVTCDSNAGGPFAIAVLGPVSLLGERPDARVAGARDRHLGRFVSGRTRRRVHDSVEHRRVSHGNDVSRQALRQLERLTRLAEVGPSQDLAQLHERAAGFLCACR